MAGDGEVTFTPLHRGQLSVLRLRAFILVIFLLGPVIAVDATVLRETALPFGLAPAAAALLLGVLAFVSAGRRYRSWGYRFEEDELHIRSGVWTRSHTVVPFGRVQHIDVGQGPVERRFALGTLTLHTAGTRSSAVALPGLPFEEAGRMRDEIRAKIRQDLL